MQAAVDFVARCLSSYAYGALGGIKIVKMSWEEYEALETKDENTIYIVVKSNKIVIYVGELSMIQSIQAGYATLDTKSKTCINAPQTVNDNNLVMTNKTAIVGNATIAPIGG